MSSPLEQLPTAAVLALGAHPDDIEIAAAGTLLLLRSRGHTFVLVDATRGEAGSRGTVEQRAAEAKAASERLGASARANLDLPDTGLCVDDDSTQRLVRVLRVVRPRLLLAPHAHDVHPDHVALAQLADRAFFLAGLRHFAPHLGAPHRPALMLRYPGNHPIEPTLVVDIGSQAAAKADILRCYRSQLAPPDRAHLVLGLDVAERAEVRDRFHGARIGVAAAEAFWHDGPLPVRDVSLLLGS